MKIKYYIIISVILSFISLTRVLFILMPLFGSINIANSLPAYENAIEMYEDNDCLTEESRSVDVEWVVVGDYRIEFFHLPNSEDVGYWKEHCHYQRMQIIDLSKEEVVLTNFGRYKPIFKSLKQNEYLFIVNTDSPTSNEIFGWFFGGKSPVEILYLNTRGNYQLSSENSIEVNEIKPHPDGDSYWNCAMSMQPYNTYKYILNPTGFKKEIIKEGSVNEECL